MGVVLIIFSSVFILGPISVALAFRLAKGGTRLDPASTAEIRRLREEVDRLTGEVHRLTDEQGFIIKLLDDGERKRLAEGPRKDS
jgi:hypothetical protein